MNARRSRRLSRVGLLPRPGKWPSMFPLSVTTSAPSSRRTVGVAGADILFPQSTAIRGRRDRPRTPPRTRGPRRGSRRGCRRAPSRSTRPTPPGASPATRSSTARSASRSNSLPSRCSDPVVGRRVVRGREHHAVPSPARRARAPGSGAARRGSTRTPRTRGPLIAAAIAGPSRVRRAEDDLVGSRPLFSRFVLQPRRRGRRPTRAPVSLAFRRYRGSPRFRTSPYFRCRPAFVRSRRLRVAVGIALPRRPRGVLTRQRTQPPPMTDRTRAHVRLRTRAGRLLSRRRPATPPGGGASTAGSATSTTGASRPSSRTGGRGPRDGRVVRDGEFGGRCRQR